jgi:lipid-A-disaccharide synthase
MLAGSRKDEVRHILPQMIKASGKISGYQFVLAGVHNLPAELYEKIIGDEKVKLITDKTYELLRISEAAMVKSGTSTLEAALMGTPQVVCYSGDAISFEIAKRLVKLKFISLVNLIMDREVVKELLQDQLTPENIISELKKILVGGSERERMISAYMELSDLLGPAGASERIACEMVKLLKKS